LEWRQREGLGVVFSQEDRLLEVLYVHVALTLPHPTAEAELINAYLSRYICRIGISDKRLEYDAQAEVVRLEYKDYRQ